MENRVTIYGASDDLIEVEGDVPGCDEYPETDAHFVLIGDQGKTRIRCWYTRRGLWAIAVAPVTEGEPMLHVTIEAQPPAGYSACATIDGVSLVIHEKND